MFVLPKSCGGELPPVGTRVMFDIVQAAVVVAVLFTRFRGIGKLRPDGVDTVARRTS